LLHDQSHLAVNTKVELAELTVKEGFDEVNISDCRASSRRFQHLVTGCLEFAGCVRQPENAANDLIDRQGEGKSARHSGGYLAEKKRVRQISEAMTLSCPESRLDRFKGTIYTDGRLIRVGRTLTQPN
jgi:hypothetical protein